MRTIIRFVMIMFVLQVMVFAASAQTSADGGDANQNAAKSEPKRDTAEKRVGLDVSLHLLVAGNGTPQGGKVPSLLDSVAKEIRNTLNVNSVGLATTLLHRVETFSGLSVKGIGTSSLASPTSNPQTLPTFYDYNINQVLLRDETGTQNIFRINRFTFAMRFPIYLSPKAESSQSVSYESIAISTSATLKENEPTILGTTNLGRPDETLIVVMTIKRVISR
jgi:hypothetical protein